MRDGFDPSDYTKECARKIGEMANSFSFSPESIAKQIARTEHRTIQQSITRFCIAWLRVCASDDYGYDGRNEASHRVAKQLLDGKDIGGLPFI